MVLLPDLVGTDFNGFWALLILSLCNLNELYATLGLLAALVTPHRLVLLVVPQQESSFSRIVRHRMTSDTVPLHEMLNAFWFEQAVLRLEFHADMCGSKTRFMFGGISFGSAFGLHFNMAVGQK